MARRRTGAIITAGVLNIVFGSLFAICCGACGLAGQLSLGLLEKSPFMQVPGSGNLFKEIFQEVETELPFNRAIQITNAAAYLTMGVVWIILGIGLLQMKAWARWGTIVLGIVVVLWTLAMTTYSVAFVVPGTQRANQRVMERHPELFKNQPPPTAGQTYTSMIGPVFQGALCIAMAAAVVILMLIRGTRRAFSDESSAEDYADEGWSGAGRHDEDWNKGRDDDWNKGREDDRGRGGFRAQDR